MIHYNDFFNVIFHFFSYQIFYFDPSWHTKSCLQMLAVIISTTQLYANWAKNVRFYCSIGEKIHVAGTRRGDASRGRKSKAKGRGGWRWEKLSQLNFTHPCFGSLAIFTRARVSQPRPPLTSGLDSTFSRGLYKTLCPSLLLSVGQLVGPWRWRPWP